MLKPVRLQLSRKRGADLQGASRALNGRPAVHCARPGRWGNPFITTADARTAQGREARRQVVLQFELWLQNTPEGRRRARAAREVLRGRNLACWCRLGDPCHADVLLRVANA